MRSSVGNRSRPSLSPLLDFTLPQTALTLTNHVRVYKRKTMRLALVLSLVAALFAVATASAGISDPRKCSYGAARKADCARDAAKLVARKWLPRKSGQPYIWQGPMTCTQAKPPSILIWRCSFSSRIVAVGTGYLTVTYRATSTGWHVYVTRTLTA